MCSYFCKNLPVVMYRKFRNVPIFKDPPICPYFLGFRVGKYGNIAQCQIAIMYITYDKVFGGTPNSFVFWLFPENGSILE